MLIKSLQYSPTMTPYYNHMFGKRHGGAFSAQSMGRHGRAALHQSQANCLISGLPRCK